MFQHLKTMPRGVYIRTDQNKRNIGESMKKQWRESKRINYGFQKGYHSKTEFKNGYKLSEETKKKMSLTKIGHKVSEETRRKLSIANSGERNYRWNPNREEVKRNERNDSAYQQWVKRVKKRDKYTCRLKNKDCLGYLIVHHIKSWAKYPDLRYKIDNGITLCQFHHPSNRKEEGSLQPIFFDLIKENHD